MRCWIIYNASLQTEKFLDQVTLLEQAATRQQVHAQRLSNAECWLALATAPLPDFLIFLDKDDLLACACEQQGIPVFNSSATIAICDHKGKQALAFQKADIPTPKTIIAPKVYKGFSLVQHSFYQQVLETLTLPLIIKAAQGSFGMQVFLIQTEKEFYEKIATLEGQDFLFQAFIAESEGRDIRVNLVGDTIVAAMGRQSTTDFRANITNGGTAIPIHLTKEQEEVARAAAHAVKASFAGVDLLYGKEGPLVCEVNGTPHLRNIKTVTGIDVADFMISYCLEAIQ